MLKIGGHYTELSNVHAHVLPVQRILKHLTRRKLRLFGGRNLDGLAGTGITSLTGGTGGNRESAPLKQWTALK